ncbi:hypothetical protein [Rufibacter hautae]|uniref:Lipoprotein n=1 Tax=Rufibacter hautae TaxID=2595005 RepID=A0A5B6TU05_9BACT|nr:hypothetical protein [Rufibacter hautae]KAA3440028.1 hypothetical protein FOA19_04995 [Rufibacter hautae]
MTKSVPVVLMILISSCVSYHVTDEGGYRVDNPKVFKYNRPKYNGLDKGAIDTTAIYFLDSTNRKHPEGWKKRDQFCRFFSGGQVVFISSEGMPDAKLINNAEKGTPGYYFIEGDRIRIDLFQDLNGGQTGKYFGKVQGNGDIMFYEQRPETYYGSFRGLERDGQKSFWKRIRVDHITPYKPNW